MQPRSLLVLGCFCAGLFVQAPALTPSASHTPFSIVSTARATELSKAQVQNAKYFVTQVSEDGIRFLSDPDLSQEERIKEFKALLSRSFAMKTIARFAMGRYWRTATSDQKAEYLKLFKENILDVYSRRFSEYSGQKVEVRDARTEGKADVIVSSFIVSEGAPEVQVDWRVRLKNDAYKVVDVIVEGVSMALTQRSDYSSVIQRGGGQVEVLLTHLR